MHFMLKYQRFVPKLHCYYHRTLRRVENSAYTQKSLTYSQLTITSENRMEVMSVALGDLYLFNVYNQSIPWTHQF